MSKRKVARLCVIWHVPPAIFHESHGDFRERTSCRACRAHHHLILHPIHLPVRSRGSAAATLLDQHLRDGIAVVVLTSFGNHVRRLDCRWHKRRWFSIQVACAFDNVRDGVHPVVRAGLAEIAEERLGEHHRVEQLVNARVELVLEVFVVHVVGAPVDESGKRPPSLDVNGTVSRVRKRGLSARALLSCDVDDQVRVWNARAAFVRRASAAVRRRLRIAQLVGAKVVCVVVRECAARANVLNGRALASPRVTRRRPVRVALTREEEVA